jgi:hypothetical protein
MLRAGLQRWSSAQATKPKGWSRFAAPSRQAAADVETGNTTFGG